METLRKSLSRLSLAEPNAKLSAQQLMKFEAQKSGWLRYKKKSFVLLNNVNFFHRYINRFFKWPNRFVLLTRDAVHVFKTEFQNKTERTLNLVDVQTVTMCSDTELYKCCIKLVPYNAENLPMLLAAPVHAVQEDWYAKINENLSIYKNEHSEDAQGEYTELVPEYWNNQIELSDDEFVNRIITYHGTRDELAELFEMCAICGNYVIRRSRTEQKAVLSVFNGSDLKEYLIIRKGNKLTLNMKVIFDNIKELLEYYQMCSLPKSKDFKLTGPFNTFSAVNTKTH